MNRTLAPAGKASAPGSNQTCSPLGVPCMRTVACAWPGCAEAARSRAKAGVVIMTARNARRLNIIFSPAVFLNRRHETALRARATFRLPGALLFSRWRPLARYGTRPSDRRTRCLSIALPGGSCKQWQPVVHMSHIQGRDLQARYWDLRKRFQILVMCE